MPNWYYIRSEKDGQPVWVKTSGRPSDSPYPEHDNGVLKEALPGPITLDPSDFQLYDTVEVNHQPPIDVKNCRPLSELIEMLKDMPVNEFKPYVHYNSVAPNGMLEVVWKNSGYYVEYIEGVPHLALCKDFETDEIVGVKIENLVRLKLRGNPE